MAGSPDDEFVVDFPTLGFLVADWIEAHCIIPDRNLKGLPFVMYVWQLWCTVNHYRVKVGAKLGQLNTAFFYRRSLIVAPQKTGKGPWAAAIAIAEGVGPVVFAGWADDGDVFRCEDYDCDCGFEYEYSPGEPMGKPWDTPLIQLTATSDDQTENVYAPLQSMARAYPLRLRMRVGEDFTRLPNDGKIDTVTSSARSRLGNPIIFALQDETGLYNTSNKLRGVAETQRRGAAAMGGRSIETTNPWDPSEKSVAQSTWESKREDIFKYWRQPPEHLKFKVKAERRKILQYVYAGTLTTDVVQVLEDGTKVYGHIDIDSIEAEAAELLETDPGQAERFYGGRVVAGLGTWLDGLKWDALAKKRKIAPKTQLVLGFDGSDIDDWTGIRAETQDGFQFTPVTDGGATIWNPADYDGQVPRLLVSEALEELFTNFVIIRMYCDPPYWETEVDAWAAKYGEKRVIRWATYRGSQMHAAAERLKTDVLKAKSDFSHDGDKIVAEHIRNTRTVKKPAARYYTLSKPGDSDRKIDMTVVSVLTHEAAGDATAAKLWRRKYRTISA